jgi:alkaline phosphatase D
LLGCLTDTSARFWVRTVDEVPVQVVVSISKDLSSPIKSTIASTSSKRDWTAVVGVTRLQPDTLYHYDVILNGKPTLAPKLPSFRTYRSSASKASFNIAFGGGALYNPPHERMWDKIASRGPEALLLLGDNVYFDIPGPYGEFHKYTYYRRQSRPEFRRLTSTVPVFAIWDDHDCATDDVWMGPYRDKPAWKMSQFKGFKENYNNPAYGDKEWPGCWFKFSIADVDFFMLDGRFYRTDPLAPNPTMLGPVQKAWLLKHVKKSKATFKVLASPVPWDFYTKSDSHDTWNGFRDEREEIFAFLEENKIDGIVLISADRHRSDARRIDRPNGYPFYEFESSRLTNQHKHGLKPGAIFGYNEKQSFGLLSFDTTKPDPTVTCQIISIDDETINSITVPLSEISHGTGGKGVVYIDNKPVKSNEIVFTKRE